MGVKDYDLNPDNNTQINGINIAEGCPPSGINDAIRQMMADVKADKDAQDKALTTPATASTLGVVKPGTGMTVNAAGKLDVKKASTSNAGIVQLNNTVTSTSITQAATSNAVKTAYDKAVAALAAIANALPVGALLPSFASSMNGYLLCNGAAVSRRTYANLFAILGTAFGAGNGSTTFNLPDFRDKTFWGANGNLMAILAAGLPNITGNVFPTTYTGATDGTPIGGDGAFNTVTNRGDIAVGKADYIGKGYYPYANFNASRSSAIYGKSTTVQPPAIAVNIFIKY